MSYYFIENRNPGNDPNIDLRFDDDILYTELTRGDELDKYNTPYVVNDVRPARGKNKRVDKKKQTKSNKTNDSSTKIYVLFIIGVICLVLLWYFYGSSQDTNNIDIVDTYPDQPELTMMSPDMGMDTRFIRL